MEASHTHLTACCKRLEGYDARHARFTAEEGRTPRKATRDLSCGFQTIMVKGFQYQG